MTNTLEQDIQEALGAVHDGGITISTGSTRQADDIRETLIWALDIAEDVDKLNARIKELELTMSSRGLYLSIKFKELRLSYMPEYIKFERQLLLSEIEDDKAHLANLEENGNKKQ